MSDSISALFDMSGKVALITGAGRGIGLAMGQALAAAGCAVALQDIDQPTAQREADAINIEGGKALALGGDISDLTLPARLIGEVVNHFGRLDVLVNNAAIQTPAPWEQDPVANIQAQFTANLVSPIVFIQEAWKIFKAQNSGRIINIGSCQQRGATGDMFPYSISKGGLEKITAGLCREMAHHGVTINQIAPGWCNTYRNRAQLTTPDVAAQLGKRHVPIGRLGEPHDFKGVILLLCSNAGSYITGQQIFIDGGLTGTGPG